MNSSNIGPTILTQGQGQFDRVRVENVNSFGGLNVIQSPFGFNEAGDNAYFTNVNVAGQFNYNSGAGTFFAGADQENYTLLDNVHSIGGGVNGGLFGNNVLVLGAPSIGFDTPVGYAAVIQQ